MAFLGVTTRSSFVNHVFHDWAQCLGARLQLECHDLAPQSDAREYRRFVEQLRYSYPRVGGALITAHKASVFDATRDLFDRLTPMADRLGEIGMAYWRGSALVGDANDAVSTVQVSRRLLASEAWRSGSRTAVIAGAGGAGIALAYTLACERSLGCERVILTEVDDARCDAIRERIGAWRPLIPIDVQLVDLFSDAVVEQAGEGSLIANATGLGKDAPGSPVSTDVRFPMNSIVWEFNYRFREQPMPTFWQTAQAQAPSANLTLEDGWSYFVWGWLVVVTNVLGYDPLGYYDCFRRAADRKRASL